MVSHKPKLIRLSEYLIEHETLGGEDMNRLFSGEDLGLTKTNKARDFLRACRI